MGKRIITYPIVHMYKNCIYLLHPGNIVLLSSDGSFKRLNNIILKDKLYYLFIKTLYTNVREN